MKRKALALLLFSTVTAWANVTQAGPPALEPDGGKRQPRHDSAVNNSSRHQNSHRFCIDAVVTRINGGDETSKILRPDPRNLES